MVRSKEAVKKMESLRMASRGRSRLLVPRIRPSRRRVKGRKSPSWFTVQAVAEPVRVWCLALLHDDFEGEIFLFRLFGNTIDLLE